MASFYTDALYSATNLGVSNTSYFSLSSTGTNTIGCELFLLSAGALNGSPVIGIGYEQQTWQLGNTVPTVSALGARKNITLKPRLSGVPSGDAPTTLTVGVSGAADTSTTLDLAVLCADGSAYVISYLNAAGAQTYSLDLSASTTTSHKNSRRKHNLGF